MRKFILAAALISLALPTSAQQQPGTPSANTPPVTTPTPAVTTPNTPPNPAAPVAGANSFTESQAKSRLEASGYSNVTALHKDANGIWRGQGTRGGQTVDVSLDFQGNVTPR